MEAHQDDDDKLVVINLENLENTEVFEANNLIYKTEFEKLIGDIIKRIGANINAPDNHMLYQPCFFINGSRGSGKSTLLRALQRSVCRERNEKPRIHHLADIDPTMLADGEPFFVHLMGRVQKLLNHRREEYLEDETKKELRNLRKRIDLLNIGLASLMLKPESMGNIADAQFFVQERVEGGMSSATLQKQFGEMIELLCEHIKADAVMITVDDADMNFNKCRDIFETVRKYLLNKRIVFVFAGDLKLYSLVVRGMQMHHFGEVALKYDETRTEQRAELLDDLEEQYIMKLFPINNRVRLKDFGSLMYSDNVEIVYQDSLNKSRKYNLKHFIKELLPERVSCYVPNLMWKYLSMLHLRSALQLLSYWTRHSYEGMPDKEACLIWSKGVSRVTSHALIRSGIEASEVHESNLYTLISTIRNFVPKLKLGFDGAMLLHSVSTEMDQLTSFFLTTEVSRQVKTYHDQLIYMLVLFCMLQKDLTNEFTLQSNVICEAPMSYERQVASNFTALMLPVRKEDNRLQKRFAHGVIPLFTHDLVEGGAVQKRISACDCINDMLIRIQQEPDKDSLLYALAILHSLSMVVENNSSCYCLSVYNMLALTTRLLHAANFDKDRRVNYIKRVLFELDDIKATVREVRTSDSIVVGGKTEDILEKTGDTWNRILRENTALVDMIVDDIGEWVDACAQQEILVTANSLVNCWHAFIRESMLESKRANTICANVDELVTAGNLFAGYMSSWRKALAYSIVKLKGDNGAHISHGDNQLSKCPIWNIVRSVETSQNVEKETSLEKTIRCFNRVNIGLVETLLNPASLRRFFDMRLRSRKMRLEYSFRDEAEDVLNSEKIQFLRRCDDMSEKIRMRYSESVYGLMFGGSSKRQKPLESLSDKDSEKISSHVGRMMKNLKRRMDTTISKLWITIQEEKIESIIGDFIKEVSTRGEELWKHLFEELSHVETEDDATKVIDTQMQKFIYKQSKLISDHKELLEGEIKKEVQKWQKELEEYVSKIIKGLPSKIHSSRNQAKSK